MRFWTEKRILWTMILLYIVVFGIFTSLRHYNFLTQTWDMGAFVQTFWNTINGRVMQNNLEQVGNHLGIHWSPFLFLLVPGYFIFQSPYFLLIVQTVAIALGALPVYLIARLRLSKPWPLIIAGAYLLYPSLQWTNSFDFHELPFVVPLLLAAFYFAEVKKWGWAGLCALLSASIREDTILLVVFFGLYFLVKRGALAQERKRGAVIAALAILYLALTLKVFMPAFSEGRLLRFDRYQHLGSTPSEAVVNVITKPALVAKTVFTPEKIKYLFWLFLPVIFLPIFSGRTLILLAPGLAENLLTNYSFQFSGFYHYDSVLIPGIFISTIYGAGFLIKKFPDREKLARIALLLAAAAAFVLRSPIGPFYFPAAIVKPSPVKDFYRQVIKIIPPEISVAAPTNIVPHLAHREHAYNLGREPFFVDMVIIDGKDSFGFPDQESFQTYIDLYLNSDFYNPRVIDNRYLLLFHKKLKVEGLGEQDSN